MNENEQKAGSVADQKSKIRERYKGIDPDELDVIPALPQEDIFAVENEQRVAVYARVSTDDPRQTSSYELQKNHYHDVISKSPNWKLVQIYADEGISGTSAEKRDDFNRMITMCELKQIDLILTKSVSRFARNVKETLEYVRKLKLLGVGVVFQKEGINTLSMGDEMLLNTFSAIAQEESVSISQNVRFSIKKKMESGEYINGCVPFGYRLENKVMIPFEPEAEIVRSLFQGYLNGASLTELCRYLEKQSISPRNQGAKWNVRVVSKMLSNEKYIGDSLYQKKYRETTVPFTQHINYGQEEQYYATGTHEGIVDKEIFASVQELLKKRRELYSRPEVAPAKYPFTHRIQCSECGTFYRRRIVNGSVVWGCNQHIEDRTACDSHYYREDRIMDAFIGIIHRLRFAEEGIIAESIELTEKAILLKKRNNLQAMESSQSMAELNAKLLMLEQLKSKGYLAPDVFETQSREINGQINEIKTKRIQSLSSALDVALEEFKTLQARLNEIDEPLDSFDPKLFEEVIKGMTVNNRDEMTFRLIGDLTFTVRL